MAEFDTKTQGTAQGEMMSRPAAIPLNEGMKFTRWTLIHPIGGGRSNRIRWHCRCDCGTERSVKPQHLRSGMSRSCGCLKKETAGSFSRTHGVSKTTEYRIWAAMMNRCHYASFESKNGKTFATYRARGITVCNRWKTFENFLADMGPRPSPQHSIDRYPNNDGNYEPGNCRWATAKEQRTNQRRRISTKTKLAAALLALGHIEYEHSKQMSADQIISLYHFDHGILHAINPIDEPWNLTPRLIALHREKSRKDTGIVAKVKRLKAASDLHLTRMTTALVAEEVAKLAVTPKHQWPKRKIQNRGFPKVRRPMRGNR